MKCKKNYLVLSLLTVTLFFSACSTSKEARTIKSSIDGNWTLKTITIEGNPSIIRVKVFNEADNNCFVGSSWNFISNNGSGNYTIPASADGCSAVTRKIKWTIYEPKGEEKKFQFKRLDDKNNPLDDNNGYRLSIGSVTNDNMQLKSAITYEGNPVTVVYNFTKNNIKN
jgi:hypothetical protein